MSIQGEMDRIAQNVANTYAVLDALGADMPTEQNSDNLAATAGSAKAVLYKDQTLTDAQKTQARTNIGAASAAEVSKLSDQIVNLPSGGGASVYIGDTQPTDGTLYWLDTSEDTTVEPEEPDTPIEPEDPEVTLTSISATYTGGDVAVGTALTDLTGITVTGTYSDGSTATITGYTLSGTIAEGSNTITVSYSGKTTTITVTGVAESGGDTEENPNLAESNICTVGEGVASNTVRKFTTTDLQTLLDSGHTDLYVVTYRANNQYGHNFKILSYFTDTGGAFGITNATTTPDGTLMTDFVSATSTLTDSPNKAIGKFSIQALLNKLTELISDGTLDSTERYGVNTIALCTTSPVIIDKILYSYDPNYKV